MLINEVSIELQLATLTLKALHVWAYQLKEIAAYHGILRQANIITSNNYNHSYMSTYQINIDNNKNCDNFILQYYYCFRIITWKDLRADSMVKKWNSSLVLKSVRTLSYFLYTISRRKKFLAGSVFKLMNSQVNYNYLDK